jgi:hypothetical protein
MDQQSIQKIDAVLQHFGFPNYATISAQIFNNGSFNIPLIRTLTGRGIVVKLTFGEDRADSYTVELTAEPILKDVSDTPYQVRWPADIAEVLGRRGLTATEALQYVSVAELRMLEGMTPRMMDHILREMHARQIFLQQFPSPERMNIMLANSVESLGLPKRVQQSLIEERIFTIGVLLTWTSNALVALPGLGKSSVAEIERKLNNIGLQLRKTSFYDHIGQTPYYRSI